jgi:acyl-coenzyme A thioesterase PaaI-like protein
MPVRSTRHEERPVSTPIFDRDGDRFVATPHARGPWDPNLCHGGAPAALLASLVDTSPSHVPMQGVRLTFDLARPVPIGVPLTAPVRVVRDGRRVQLIEADLQTDDGTVLVHTRALRVRAGEVAVPSAATDDEPSPPEPPDDLPRFGGHEGWEPEGFWSAMDVRFVEGVLGDPGPGTAWFRVDAEVADGVELTPLARAAAAADFGNGIGPPLPIDRFLYINPDLSVDLHRLPIGEWVGMQASSVAQPTGIGLTTSTLFDERGRIGLAAQSLFVDQRA